MHDADVILRGSKVRRVFEGDPRMAGLKEHCQHLAPELDRFHPLETLEVATVGHRFILLIPVLKGRAIQVVQIRHVARIKASSARSPPRAS